MIFVDSNIPMYLVGADHPNKTRGAKMLSGLVERRERLVTSAEVFQEILHRYTAIRRRDAIEPAWRALEGLVDETFDIEIADVEGARDLLAAHEGISSRDALHAATMKRRSIGRILSFDSGFDAFADLLRLA